MDVKSDANGCAGRASFPAPLFVQAGLNDLRNRAMGRQADVAASTAALGREAVHPDHVLQNWRNASNLRAR